SSLPSIDDDARRRFEAAWLAGIRPDIEQFLPPEHPAFLATLEELVLIDLEFAWRAVLDSGGPTAATAAWPLPVEAYLRRFPPLNRPEVVGRLVEQERKVRCRPGEPGTATQTAIPTDRVVGCYKLHRRLGGGTFGEVWLGTHRHFGGYYQGLRIHSFSIN